MGSANSRIINVINGSRFTVYVGLGGKMFEYRKEGSGEMKRTISVRIPNGSYSQIYAPEKYMEMTIECKDEEDREVKQLHFYTRDDFSWIVRNFGVTRQKAGVVGLVTDEDYAHDASSFYQQEGGNWKYDHGEKIRFYYWDVDRESLYAQRDREDREILEAMRDAEHAYGENKNWLVLSQAFHPKGFSRPTAYQKQIAQEFIAACQLYTATLTNKVPLLWLIHLNVESLKSHKELGGWRIEVQGIDNVNDNLQFERIALAFEHHVFALIHIQRGPNFTIHRIQESLTDSMVNRTEVWITDPNLDLRQQDRGNRNLRLYNDADVCKCWIPGKKKNQLD